MSNVSAVNGRAIGIIIRPRPGGADDCRSSFVTQRLGSLQSASGIRFAASDVGTSLATPPNDSQTDPYRPASQEAVLLREVVRRVRTLPGVKDAAVGDMAALPLGHGRNDLNPFSLIREGHEIPANPAPVVDAAIVSPEYFNLLGISLLRGRIFGDQDIERTPPVAVINKAMEFSWQARCTSFKSSRYS